MSEVNSGSPSFSLNAGDLVSIGKNAALVGLAAALAYVGQNVANLDLGAGTALVVPVVVVVINTLNKWIKDNTK